MAFSNAVAQLETDLNAIVVNGVNLFPYPDQLIRDLTADGVQALGFDASYILRYDGGGDAFEEIVSSTGVQEAKSRFTLQIGTYFDQDPTAHYAIVEERGQKAWSAMVTSKLAGHIVAVLPIGNAAISVLEDRRTVWIQQFEMIYKV